MNKVSICIPTFNGAKFIGSAIKSVLEQTYQDFDLIVCDDASTDRTLEIVSKILDKRLSIHRNPKRLGLVGNWNRCLQLARGEYFVLMHQDDLMHQDNLTAKVAFLEAHPSVGFVHSNIRCIDESGNDIGGHWLPQAETNCVEPGMKCFERLISIGNFICCPSVMARRNCFERFGSFDSRLPFTVDLEMWLRLSSHCDVGYLAMPLIQYRLHNKQETQKFSAGRDVIEVGRAIRIALNEHLASSASVSLRRQARLSLVRWAFRQARWQARIGHIRHGLGYLWAAMRVGIGYLP